MPRSIPAGVLPERRVARAFDDELGLEREQRLWVETTGTSPSAARMRSLCDARGRTDELDRRLLGEVSAAMLRAAEADEREFH